MEIIGWDIGGAHLKFARTRDGRLLEARQLPCALWQGLERLTAALDEALADRPTPEMHAVTMTGELADLFADRASGVRAILAAMEARIARAATAVYANDGSFLSGAAAAAQPERVASANWHASALWAAARLREGLLVDIGSTTTDLTPFHGGAVRARGHDDARRLATDELVYRGVVRTPVMAVVQHVELEGERVGVMAEFFATMADVYRVTGELPDRADQHSTADGRGKSPAESRARLARMVGRDAASAPDGTWDALARTIAGCQLQQLREAAQRVTTAARMQANAPLVGAGVGSFVARSLALSLERPYCGFEELIDAPAGIAVRAADCAPAVAVALLCGEARSSAARTRAMPAGSSGPSLPPEARAERKPR